MFFTDITLRVRVTCLMASIPQLTTETTQRTHAKRRVCRLFLFKISKYFVHGIRFMRHFRSKPFSFCFERVNSFYFLKGLGIKNKTVARLIGKVEIQARSECVISGKCDKKFALMDLDFGPQKVKGVNGVHFSKAKVRPNIDGEFMITVLNVNSENIDLANRSIIGKMTPPKEIIKLEEKATSHIPEVNFGKNLNVEQRETIRKLIADYDDLLASNPKKPNRTNLAAHEIDTGDAKPSKVKTRRILYAWENEVDIQISEMLENDIIKPSQSPWNSPILLARKKDNTTRFICDFRELNKLTKKDAYPLPNIQDVLDRMSGSKYWTTLDAAAAYWSIPLAEYDQEKTAFSVLRGKYQFLVTPFGLCNGLCSAPEPWRTKTGPKI